ncbi:MAG: adenylate/guanylate cyclase domain-containing protein [Erysipelotrichaceae bacterium]|nr:adenylate/guanylate cyclase domain-containing protein [Erysipelotrichaceae bacterium]
MLGSLDGNKNILLLILVLLSFFSIFFSRLSLFERADLYVADALYQKGNVSAGKIVIVQIDEKTLAALGSDPLSWDRKAFAEVLNVLNTKGNEPAVIGVDVLFAHEKDKESDEALVQAAGDNVVLAGMYYYGNKLETGTDGFYVWQKDAVIDEAMPYEGLRKKAETGIVNLTSDKDGKVRHMRIFYPGKEDREASFALAVARRYAAYTGTELVLPEKDHAYLEFTYPAGGYLEKISFIDVKEGKYPASYFAGKIVLIGACAAAMQDEYLTAVDRNRAMYGVEVHANSIEMLLRGEYKTEVNDTLQRTAVLCVLLLGAAVYAFAGIKGMLGIYGASLLLSLAACVLGYRFGYVLHPLWLPFGAGLQFIAGIASRFLAEQASRKKLRRQFGQYVDPSVLRKILNSGGKDLQLTGKECDVAVLFVDICGFTTLSEKLPPEKVVDILNHYLNMVTECIMNNGGTLDKFIGDCAMAFWNAPYVQEDPIGKAIQAGMDMIEGSQRLNKELGFDLGFAIGINYGKAVIGNIGSDKRMDFTAIGDCVNTASRLESLKIPGEAREGKIYLSGEVYDRIKDRYEGKDLGEHALKGKEKKVRIYALG